MLDVRQAEFFGMTGHKHDKKLEKTPVYTLGCHIPACTLDIWNWSHRVNRKKMCHVTHLFLLRLEKIAIVHYASWVTLEIKRIILPTLSMCGIYFYNVFILIYFTETLFRLTTRLSQRRGHKAGLCEEMPWTISNPAIRQLTNNGPASHKFLWPQVKYAKAEAKQKNKKPSVPLPEEMHYRKRKQQNIVLLQN